MPVPCHPSMNKKCRGRPPLLTEIGPPYATQPGGAQRRSAVHNVVWYPRGGAQRSSHKPRHTDRQMGPK